MELIIYFVTVFPVGLLLLGLAAWYDYKHVPTVKFDVLPSVMSLFKEPKDFSRG